mmetsp:Transcript_19871/g.47733  ORF Transcript_19871/g.47733 Transcript_19871/m.47733 type:complete len:203 (+) Transcript_19871:1536-2144(+)
MPSQLLLLSSEYIEQRRGRALILDGRRARRHVRSAQRRSESHADDPFHKLPLRHRRAVHENLAAPFRRVLLAHGFEFAFIVAGDPFGSGGGLIGHSVSAARFAILAVRTCRITAQSCRGIQHDIFLSQPSEQFHGLLGIRSDGIGIRFCSGGDIRSQRCRRRCAAVRNEDWRSESRDVGDRRTTRRRAYEDGSSEGVLHDGW